MPVIVASRDAVAVMRKHLEDQQVIVDKVLHSRLEPWRTFTPTVYIVDSKGLVRRAFIGKLDSSAKRNCCRSWSGARCRTRAIRRSTHADQAETPGPRIIASVVMVRDVRLQPQERRRERSRARLFERDGSDPSSASRPPTRKRRSSSTRVSRWSTHSISAKPSIPSSTPPNWTRTRRCRTGASRSPTDRTTTPGWSSRDRERAGFDAIQTAAGLAPNAPEPERAYIDALARCFTDQPKPDQPKLARDYSDAMREVYRRYPDDPDAAALFAASLMNLNPWHLWKIDGQPGPDTPEIVAVLEEALRRWPEHTGVNHFYIHTMEGSRYPERALPSAHRLETLAPAAGHLVHMPSHIYLRTGDYAAAVRSNQQAIAADRNYRRSSPSRRPESWAIRTTTSTFLRSRPAWMANSKPLAAPPRRSSRTCTTRRWPPCRRSC